MTLGTVANESKSVVLEVFLELGQRPVAALVDGLLRPSEVERLDTASSLQKDLSKDHNTSRTTVVLEQQERSSLQHGQEGSTTSPPSLS